MRTEEKLITLYKKFDRDVEKRKRWMRVLLAIDQFFNVLVWNGSQDETISSHIGRKQLANTSTWFDDKVCYFLRKMSQNHCRKSLGE